MIKQLKLCFGKNELNTGRQLEIDIAKVIAIIFMVLVHTYEFLALPTNDYYITIIDKILGSIFTAPVFMFALGFGIIYKKKENEKSLIKKGISLILLGYLLNIVRDGIPMMIAYYLSNDISYLENVKYCYCIDILQFAGITFLFFAFVKKFNFSNLYLISIGFALSAFGLYLQDFSSGNEFADAILGFFYGTNENTYFPLFNWIIFPIIGYVFGDIYKYIVDKKKFYNLITPYLIIITIIYILITIFKDFYYFSNGNFYFMGPIDAFFIISIIILHISLIYKFTIKISKFLKKYLTSLSKNVLIIYLIHYIILGYLLLIFEFLFDIAYLPENIIIPIGILLFIFSANLSLLISKYQSKQKNKNNKNHHKT